MKQCTKCKKKKPKTAFNKDSRRLDKLTPWCKKCKAKAWKQLDKKKKIQRQEENLTTLVCRLCDTEKTIENFYLHAGSKTGYREECKTCRTEYERKRYKKDSRAVISRRMKYLYGITLAEYDLLLEQQNGHCMICETTEPGGGKGRFAIDHNHSTGEIRGLLCCTCNRGLGFFRDDPHYLRQAAKYLELYNG